MKFEIVKRRHRWKKSFHFSLNWFFIWYWSHRIRSRSWSTTLSFLGYSNPPNR